MEKNVDIIMKKLCDRQKDQMATDYSLLAAKQASILESKTVHLGEEFFATSLGEVWKKYACRPTIVKARASNLCFTSLPITLNAKDEAIFKRRLNPTEGVKKIERFEKEAQQVVGVRKNNTQASDFFMEPDSHRITRVTDQVPCDNFFAPIFRSTNDDYIEVSSGMFRVYEEKIFQDSPLYNNTSTFVWEKIDWNHVGVYSPEQIISMETSQNHRTQLTQLTKQNIFDNSYDGGFGQRQMAYRIDADGFIRGYGDGILVNPLQVVSDTWDSYLNFILNGIGIYVIVFIFWRILKIAMNVRADLLVGATPGKAFKRTCQSEFSSVQNFLEARRVRLARKQQLLRQTALEDLLQGEAEIVRASK